MRSRPETDPNCLTSFVNDPLFAPIILISPISVIEFKLAYKK